MKRYVLIAYIVFVSITLCVTLPIAFSTLNDASTDAPQNRDPRAGWVTVFGSVLKRCDGSTLVYTVSGGISTVPQSPECAR